VTIKNSNFTDTYSEPTLTEIEMMGLLSRYDLANGHASHELTASQRHIIHSLPVLWERGLEMKSREAELMYKDAFQQLAESPSLSGYENFKICPTASNSIDVAAAWLAQHQMKTALIEPTFDNLYLILKRRGVALTSLPEDVLHSGDYDEKLKNVDAVFLVNPNNPTGRIISSDLFREFINWCADNKKVVVLDHSFRFFVPQTFDVYQMLVDSGVTFITLEDTGKVWPTQELKASLLVSSADIFHEIDLIYDEIFLCHSNFTLLILTEFLRDAKWRGLYDAVWKNVEKRRNLFRHALADSMMTINEESLSSMLSVEWVRHGSYFANDLDVVEHFKLQQLVLLPGRQFFWNHKGREAKTEFIRFALMKPENEFINAIALLEQELKMLAA
jgi:aspartate/methionine/tyrosine aminotransferase